ncbi:hypothetical protein K7957_02170 [Sphingomonas yunnanensis]|uniref:hypothetical protein n=1 Tax=Sphingomonas yunnanensis TaxID=310400 RepID=UPI001CA6ACA7|nr:hypothetical protein [Sphingomonas yunnanensis]MBY9061737.1 hypothetical protein [Sphingomonas yunnanensis]
MSARETLVRVAAQRGETLAQLSLKVGRGRSYLSRFVARGTPRRLPEFERRHLAIVLDVDERLLGARDPWAPSEPV